MTDTDRRHSAIIIDVDDDFILIWDLVDFKYYKVCPSTLEPEDKAEYHMRMYLKAAGKNSVLKEIEEARRDSLPIILKSPRQTTPTKFPSMKETLDEIEKTL